MSFAVPLPLQQQHPNMLCANKPSSSTAESSKLASSSSTPAQLQKSLTTSLKPLRPATHRKGKSSVTLITGKTPIKVAQEAAVRSKRPQLSKRSQSPAVKDGIGAALASQQASSSSGDVTFRLPLVLPRPKQMPMVNTDTLKEIDPSLLGVSLPLIKDILATRTESMLRGLASVDIKTAQLPPTGMPTSIALNLSSPVDPTSPPHLPTHLLCVVNPSTSHGQLYPVHSLVLGAHCAHLPRFPLPAHAQPGQTTTTFPIVPITLPHAESFPILFDYLYTKNFSRFVASMIPLPAHATPPSLADDGTPLSADDKFRRVVDALVQTYSMGALLEKMKFVHGVWSNVFRLGIAEEGAWKCMNTAWTALVRALVKAREAQVQLEKPAV